MALALLKIGLVDNNQHKIERNFISWQLICKIKAKCLIKFGIFSSMDDLSLPTLQ